MTRFLSNRDGGKTDEKGHLRFMHSSTRGDVWSGGRVTQNSTPNMSVMVSIIDALIRDSANGYAYAIWSDAAENVSVSTANASNARKDYVIAYVDRAVTPQTANANNGGIWKLIVVAGTPAGSPVYPTTAEIQASAVGTNPYIIIAGIDVPAAATTITDGMIKDLRKFAFNREIAGVVKDYAGGTIPEGFLLCYGQAVSRTTYDRLYAAIGTTWGSGDGSTTFNVPDLRGRTTAGVDAMGGTAANRLTNQSGGVAGTLGAVGGAQTHALTIAEMPSHNHGGNLGIDTGGIFGIGGGGSSGKGITTSGTAVYPSSITVQSQGGNGAHNNIQPTAVVNKMIAY